MQIISGQLQLHRIHPQNILLTGSSPVLQSNHVILNNTTTQPTVVLDTNSTSSAVTASRPPPTSSNGANQEVIAFVNQDASTSRLQMVYSPSANAVIYAPHATTSNLKRTDTVNISSTPQPADVVALQHTPVIQTSSMTQATSNGWQTDQVASNRGEILEWLFYCFKRWLWCGKESAWWLSNYNFAMVSLR